MTGTSSAHAGKTLRCGGVLTDDDGEPITREQELPDNHPDAPGTHEVEQHCSTELTFDDHGRFVRSPQSKEARERFESSVLRWDCPECGNTMWTCPVCTDPDDRSPAGWIDSENERGEFKQIPCHNCNHAKWPPSGGGGTDHVQQH